VPVVAFANENIAKEAAGAHIENPPAGLTAGIG
jgi:hypothetical protein